MIPKLSVMARILIIEDDPQVRAMLEAFVRSAGHEVSVSEDGQQGTTSFRKKPADVVITDLVMPNQDGIETIVAFKKEFPKVPIIAMSGGSARDPILSAATKLGAVAILEKPFGR